MQVGIASKHQVVGVREWLDYGNKARFLHAHGLGNLVSTARSAPYYAALHHRVTQAALSRCSRLICQATHQELAKHRIVFLGTPEVAASVLQKLHTASDEPEASFKIAAVVTQPERAKGRGRKDLQPSPVAQLALDCGLSEDVILTPVKAREEPFLERMRALEPDLCITAAYGNVLPTEFLEIPRFGTLNIHPSLLPKYRGAAPVQRALQDGVSETGVSVVFTVRAMDAGPVLAQQRVPVDDKVQAPELLADLFARGTHLLISHLPEVWSGEAAQIAVPQDEAAATHAAKLDKAEGQLDFREPADVLHNKVRAFAGWPGTHATLCIQGDDGQLEREVLVKVTRTRVVHTDSPASSTGLGENGILEVSIAEGLQVPCQQGGLLDILELQPSGKKVMPATAFLNGVKGRRLLVKCS